MDEILKALLGLGAAGPLVGFLFWLWWTERDERREQSKKLLELNIEQIAAEKDMTAALTALTARIK